VIELPLVLLKHFMPNFEERCVTTRVNEIFFAQICYEDARSMSHDTIDQNFLNRPVTKKNRPHKSLELTMIFSQNKKKLQIPNWTTFMSHASAGAVLGRCTRENTKREITSNV